MKEDREEVDGKAAWRIAVAAVTILTISYGGPLISVVSMKAIAAEARTDPDALKAAPTRPIRARLDETLAARKPVLVAMQGVSGGVAYQS